MGIANNSLVMLRLLVQESYIGNRFVNTIPYDQWLSNFVVRKNKNKIKNIEALAFHIESGLGPYVFTKFPRVSDTHQCLRIMILVHHFLT